MHIKQGDLRDRNVLAAWALSFSDAVREAAERATEMGGGAPAALVAIVADPGLSIDDLRKVLALTHPGTVRLVDRLVDHAWVQRERGVGRTVHLTPTKAGRSAERRLAAAREQAVTAYLAGIADPDLHVMAELIADTLSTMSAEADGMRRICRLCDHTVCEPCPAEHT